MRKNNYSGALFRTIALMSILLIAAAPAFAVVLKSAVIQDQLKKDLSMTEKINITLSENSDPAFALTLPANSLNIIVNGQNYSNNSLNISLSCNECQINISYTLDNIIKKEGAKHSFYRTINFPKIPESQIYTIQMPSGYTINLSDQTSPSVVPKPANISTDGASIIITWKDNKPLLPMQYLVVYYSAEESESFIEALRNDLGHPAIILFCIIILAIGFGIGFFVKKIDAKKTIKGILSTKVKSFIIPSSLLSPDEKIVVDLLKKKNSKKNPVNQKDIGKELNWSKSKVSAVLSNLYYKKLIDREKFGRNYKVRLVKEVH